MNHTHMPALHSAEIRRVRIATQFPPSVQSLEALVGATGLHRTLGGVDVYLALRARMPSLTASDLHEALLEGTLTVGPTVRGCIYLGLAEDRSLMLGIASLLARGRVEKDMQKVKVSAAEIKRLGDTIVKTLNQTGELSTDALRKTLPAGAVRSLGEAGKKTGLSSTLPPTLRLLEFDGRIKRVPENGRVDVERYLWSSAEPFEEIPRDTLVQQLAERFFAWSGLATVDAFTQWSGLGKREARAAVDALDLTSWDCGGVACLGDAAAVEKVLGRGEEVVALLPFEDNLVALSQGLALWFDARHHALKLPEWGRAGTTSIGESRYALLRPILANGMFVGFWEYDPAVRAVAIGLLEKVTRQTREKIDAVANNTAVFLRDSFDHARSFSLDNDAEVAKRVKQVRALAAG